MPAKHLESAPDRLSAELLITNKICNTWPWMCLSQWPNYVWASENGGLCNTFFNSLKRLTQYLSWAPLIKTGSHIDCIFSYLLGWWTKPKWSIHCREAKPTGGPVAEIAVNGKTTQQHLKFLFLGFEGGGCINCLFKFYLVPLKSLGIHFKVVKQWRR